MNTNEDIRNETLDEIIVLGVASIETQGPTGSNEPNGGKIGSGISEG